MAFVLAVPAIGSVAAPVIGAIGSAASSIPLIGSTLGSVLGYGAQSATGLSGLLGGMSGYGAGLGANLSAGLGKLGSLYGGADKMIGGILPGGSTPFWSTAGNAANAASAASSAVDPATGLLPSGVKPIPTSKSAGGLKGALKAYKDSGVNEAIQGGLLAKNLLGFGKGGEQAPQQIQTGSFRSMPPPMVGGGQGPQTGVLFRNF